MIGLLLVGPPGAAVAGMVIFDDDDINDAGETGQELNCDGSELLEGTDGDDTLSGGQDADLVPSMTDLPAGGHRCR